MHEVMIGLFVVGMFPRDIGLDEHFLMDSKNHEDMLPSNLLQNKHIIPNVSLGENYICQVEVSIAVDYVCNMLLFFFS